MDSALAVAVNPKSSASHSNSKYETRSTKWFDKLTTLSQVEGQIQNPNFQMFKT
jgi:hypothetical protein